MSLDWRWLAKLALLRRTPVAGLLLLTATIYAIGLAFPILTQRAVDDIISRRNLTDFAVYLLLAALALVLEAVLSHVRQRGLTRLGTFLDERIANRFFLHLLRLRADRRLADAGSIGVYFQHIGSLRSFLLFQLPRVVFDSGSAVVALVAMCMYSLPVTLCTIVLFVIAAWLMKRQIERIAGASMRQFEANGRRSNFMNETYNALSVVKVLAVEGRRLSKWRELTKAFVEQISSVSDINQRMAASMLVINRTSSLLVVAIGCYEIAMGHITIGDLIALQILALRVMMGVGVFSDVARGYKEADIALKAIRQFLQQEREPAGSRHVSAVRDDGVLIRFEDVALTYPGKPTAALSGVSFETPPRGLVAFVGRNGAGKTTLVNILLGLQRDYQGRVRLNGKDIRDLHPRVLRNMIGVTNQEATLFSGTVRNNLDVGLTGKADAEMTVALGTAGAEWLTADNGLEHDIQETGRNLSGGQRQRVAVARALMGKPHILVLDEPTAFLDPEAARRLDQALVELSADRLLLLVSHNLSATRHASLIVVLKDGAIAGLGTHSALVASCDEYQQLWNSHVESIGLHPMQL